GGIARRAEAFAVLGAVALALVQDGFVVSENRGQDRTAALGHAQDVADPSGERGAPPGLSAVVRDDEAFLRSRAHAGRASRVGREAVDRELVALEAGVPPP